MIVKDGLYYFGLTLRRSRFHIASLFQSRNNKDFEGYFDNVRGGHLIAEGGDKIFQGVKYFLKTRGVAANLGGVAQKKPRGRVSGGVLQGGVRNLHTNVIVAAIMFS